MPRLRLGALGNAAIYSYVSPSVCLSYHSEDVLANLLARTEQTTQHKNQGIQNL